MAQAQRNETERDRAHPQPTARVYDAGGHVAQLQARLAQRLDESDAVERVTGGTAQERALRLLSATGGYLALAGGYAVVAAAIILFV